MGATPVAYGATRARVSGYLAEWRGVAQVCRVERTVVRGDRTTRETAYLITSLSPARADARRLLALNRGHWGIENRLHWALDAVLGEDRNGGRTGGVPLALRLVRGAVVTLLRVAGHASITDARRRFNARPLEAIALVKRRLARGRIGAIRRIGVASQMQQHVGHSRFAGTVAASA